MVWGGHLAEIIIILSQTAADGRFGAPGLLVAQLLLLLLLLLVCGSGGRGRA